MDDAGVAHVQHQIERLGARTVQQASSERSEKNRRQLARPGGQTSELDRFDLRVRCEDRRITDEIRSISIEESVVQDCESVQFQFQDEDLS